jgi:trigger factor
MKAQFDDDSPVRKSVSIEIPADEVGQETDAVLKEFRKKARFPGFRAGKAPLDLVRNRFADEAREEVRDRLMHRSFHEAARQEGLRPIGEPKVEDVEYESGGPLRYKATFDVLPTIEPKGYEEIEVLRTRPQLADEEVERALEEIRQSRARLVVEEGREAAAGDVVVADFVGLGEDGTRAIERERMSIEVGAEGNLPAFNEHLVGLAAGGSTEFRVEYPEDFGAEDLSGKTLDFSLSVHEVKRREFPDLDDEFARDLGEFEDLAALKVRVREDLQHRKDHEEERGVRQAVLDKVLLQNPAVLPETLVESEVRHRLEDLVRGMIMQGMDPKVAEIDWEAQRKRQEEPARKMVHAGLVLDAVAKAQELGIESAEIEERIRHDAQRIGETSDVLRKRLKEQGGVETLKGQMLREKALDYLTSVANIQYSE